MAAIILENFRTHNAKEFVADFSDSKNYIFIGRSHAWVDADDSSIDDNNPPSPNNSVEEILGAQENMIALKQVSSGDVSHGLVRYDWTSGTVYDEYRDDYGVGTAVPSSSDGSIVNWFDGKGYIITDEYKVYKCLKTPYSGVNPVNSTDQPTSVSTTNPETTSDGYMWKFMYQITASDVIKFVTNDFIPVKTLGAKSGIAGIGTNGGFGSSATDDGSAQWDVENDAVDGAVFRYIVKSAGSGYTATSGGSNTFTCDIPVQGDGSGAVVTLSFDSGELVDASFKDSSSYGSGYRRASLDTIDANIVDDTAATPIATGSGAEVHVVISPIGGHGANPVDELGGNFVVVNSRLEFGEGSGDFPTDNDFRQIGLIKNPLQDSDGAISTLSTMTVTNRITVGSASGISVDDTITDSTTNNASTAVGRVVSKSGNIISYQPIANGGGEFILFQNNDDIYINASGSIVTSVNAAGVDADHPEMRRFTGDILYVENRGPVSRAADQIEDIKLIIEM